jgi:uncharacterized protein YqjF (DUF2071 family)
MNREHLTALDRMTIRQRPDGQPLMHQKWGKLLFMHWRIEENELRAIIPEQLEIDTFDGTAWIGIVPFTMWDIRGLPPFMPAVPGFSAAHELNVRTYVHLDGRDPGVWFFSLGCNSGGGDRGSHLLSPALLQCGYRPAAERQYDRLRAQTN